MINNDLYNNEITETFDWYNYFDKIYYIENGLDEEKEYLKKSGILKSNKLMFVPIKLDKKNNELFNFYEESFLTAIYNANYYEYENILIIPNSVNFIDTKKIKEVFEGLDKKSDIIILNPGDISEDCFILRKKAIKYISSLTLNLKNKEWVNKVKKEVSKNLITTKVNIPICLHKIDLIIPYVNCNDIEWKEEYKIYNKKINETRYRDYNTLIYLLRSIENNLPFINNIYLVVSSESQIPKWLVKSKIKIVYHEDIIPKKYLPVYNSCTIEMFIPFIKELSEYFIYTNDDIFFMKKMSKDMFFKDGKSINYFNNVNTRNNIFDEVCINCFKLCMKDFTDEYINNFKLLVDSKYKKMYHTAHAFFKSTCLHIHKIYGEDINKSISRFRTKENFNQYIYGLYDYISLKSINKNIGCSYKNLMEINEYVSLNGEEIYTLCINDNNNINCNFSSYIITLNNQLFYLFPVKSKYENKNTAKLYLKSQNKIISKKIDLNKKLKVALCAIAKNENRYIREWVQYYLNLGITKIYLYDNNDLDGERFEEVIDDYIKSGFVEVINRRGVVKSVKTDKDGMTTQGQAYYDCYNNHYKEYDWMCLFDIDEFLSIDSKYTDLYNFLNDFNEYDGIKVQWRMYGDNGRLFYENKPVLERFMSKNNYTYDKHIKNILRCRKYDYELSFCAHGLLNKEPVLVNVNKVMVKNTYMDVKPFDNLPVYLNHFYSKSTEEFLKRKYKKTSAVTGVNNTRNFNLDFIKKQYFEYNKVTEEKERLFDIYTTTYNSVNVYMASLYKDGHVIKSIKSIIRQPQVNKLVLSANNYTDEEYEFLLNEIKSDKLEVHRTENDKLSFEKLRYVTCDKSTPYVAFCDDDLVFYDGYFIKMIYMCETLNGVVSYHGSILKKLPIQHYYPDRKSFSFNREVKETKKIDIIGNGVSLFKRNWITNKQWKDLYNKAPIISMDDIIVSYILRKNGKDLYIIKHSIGDVIERNDNKIIDTVYNIYKKNDSYQTEFVNKYFVGL